MKDYNERLLRKFEEFKELRKIEKTEKLIFLILSLLLGSVIITLFIKFFILS